MGTRSKPNVISNPSTTSRRKTCAGSGSPSTNAMPTADGAGVDWDKIGQAEAQRIMSEEHKFLGFRPPPDSLAAQAQLAAAKHPIVEEPLSLDTLKQAARKDAERILSERKTESKSSSGAHAREGTQIDLNKINEADARLLMSFQHRALGYRPPPGSLAAEAQAAASRHATPSSLVDRLPTLDEDTLRDAAYFDAERIKATQRPDSGDVQDHADRALAVPPHTPARTKAKATRSQRPRPRGPKSDLQAPLSASSTSPSSRSHSGLDTVSQITSSPSPQTVSPPSPPPLQRTGTSDSLEIIGDVLITANI